VLLVHGTTVLAAWRLNCRTSGRGLDVRVIDELARLQLAAKRLGCSIRLRHAGPELSALVDLCGLAEVLGTANPAGLSIVEMRGESEGRKEICAEEDREFDDPTV
jgi:hypothetical protein